MAGPPQNPPLPPQHPFLSVVVESRVLVESGICCYKDYNGDCCCAPGAATAMATATAALLPQLLLLLLGRRRMLLLLLLSTSINTSPAALKWLLLLLLLLTTTTHFNPKPRLHPQPGVSGLRGFWVGPQPSRDIKGPKKMFLPRSQTPQNPHSNH